MESLHEKRERIFQEWCEEQDRIKTCQKHAERLHEELRKVEQQIREGKSCVH